MSDPARSRKALLVIVFLAIFLIALLDVVRPNSTLRGLFQGVIDATTPQERLRQQVPTQPPGRPGRPLGRGG